MNLIHKLFHFHKWGEVQKDLTQECTKCGEVHYIKCTHPLTTKIYQETRDTIGRGPIFITKYHCQICNREFTIRDGNTRSDTFILNPIAPMWSQTTTTTTPIAVSGTKEQKGKKSKK